MSPNEGAVPFRRVEHVSSGSKSILIETHCAFCAFTAVSANARLVKFAESAHDCPRLRTFRKQQRDNQQETSTRRA